MGYAGRQAPLTAHPGASEQECDLPPRRHILGSPTEHPAWGCGASTMMRTKSATLVEFVLVFMA